MMSVVDIHVYVKYTYICMYYISYISYPIYTSNLPNAFCPFFRLAFKTTLLDLVLDASHKGLVPQKLVRSTVSTSTFLVLLLFFEHKSLPKWAKEIWVHSVSLSLWNLFDTFWGNWRMKP